MVYPYDVVLPLYRRVISEYESEIGQYGFERLEMSETEMVYVIQNDFVVYLGMVDFDIHLNGGTPSFMIVFEEMKKNNVFKFNFSGFKRKFPAEDGLKMQYKKFHGWGIPIREINEITLGNYQRVDSSYTAEKYLIPSRCELVNERFPELNIKEEYSKLEGDEYYYLVLRFSYNNSNCYAIKATKKPITGKYVSAAVSEAIYEGAHYNYVRKTMDSDKLNSENDFSHVKYDLADEGKVLSRFEELVCDSKMLDTIYDLIWNEENSSLYQGKYDMFLKFDYCIFVMNFREPEEATAEIGYVFSKVRTGAYDNKFSEAAIVSADVYRAYHILLEILKEEYKEVLKDYEAPCLKIADKQYCYDFYIPCKKTAIMYRGHAFFEPIDELGGEETYDLLKKQEKDIEHAGTENGDKIVYIDYSDTISPDLVKARIENIY